MKRTMKRDKSNTYLVKEFADLAGVTVRTLHYYDEAGLLKPTLYTDVNHRLYQREDLLRLQQILTLKWMGFSLDEIRTLLDNPIYGLSRSLQIQKEAIDQRIRELQQVSLALEMTSQALDKADTPDWEMVIAIIQGMMESRKWQWISAYYTPEQRAQIEERGKHFTAADMLDAQRQWADLGAAFESHRHLPPDHPDVQKLAAEMDRLVTSFSGGDPGIEQSLRSAYMNAEKHMPLDELPTNWNTMKFMNQALEIYRRNKAEKKDGQDKST
jgi:DNA-binding transcriptional MerR regulator